MLEKFEEEYADSAKALQNILENSEDHNDVASSKELQDYSNAMTFLHLKRRWLEKVTLQNFGFLSWKCASFSLTSSAQLRVEIGHFIWHL